MFSGCRKISGRTLEAAVGIFDVKNSINFSLSYYSLIPIDGNLCFS